MSWYEYVALVVGVLASIQAARMTIWRWGKGMFHGAQAVGKFGEALPKLSALPTRMDSLDAKLDTVRVEVRQYSETDNAAHEAMTQELREHMTVEEEVSHYQEKAWLSLIETQHRLTQGQADVRHEINNVRQIVMNIVETGAGDRWRLSHHSGDETLPEVQQSS